MANSFLTPFSRITSTSFLNMINWSATIVFKMVIGAAEFAEEPTALNSNLFPVKANGEVLFRSVLSNINDGILLIPNFKYTLSPFSK